MALSNADLSDIAKEFAVAKSDMGDDKKAIPNIQEQVAKKDDQTDRIYILYNNAHVERVTPYETERRWLDGTTYTTITKSQIETFGTDGRIAYFYPSLSWTKSNPQLQANGNGNPQTSSTNSESFVLNTSLESQGLVSQIDLLRNGQAGAASRSLNLSYSPGAPDIELTLSSSFTIGKVLYISGSGTSALVRITNISGTTITITEIIPPASTIAIGGSVVENIPGFTNTERNTLVSATYQRILTQLTNRIKSTAALWNTALGNQLAQLNINIDAPAQITAAKNAVTTVQSAYSAWFALTDTGASGKFVDTSLNNLATAYNARNSVLSSRAAEITTALGSVSQDSEGVYSGTGNYLQRFKCLGFLINTANGPIYQANGLKAAKTNFEDKVKSNADKLVTFSNLVRYAGATKDPVGSTLTVDGASQFAPSDAVVLTANDLASIECTIVSISGSNIVLSATIPKEYTKATKVGIIKRV
jgi:hypothetical protein